MAISLECQCGARFQVDDSLAGQTAMCEQCLASVPVPGSRPVAAGTSPASVRHTAAAPQVGADRGAEAGSLFERDQWGLDGTRQQWRIVGFDDGQILARAVPERTAYGRALMKLGCGGVYFLVLLSTSCGAAMNAKSGLSQGFVAALLIVAGYGLWAAVTSRLDPPSRHELLDPVDEVPMLTVEVRRPHGFGVDARVLTPDKTLLGTIRLPAIQGHVREWTVAEPSGQAVWRLHPTDELTAMAQVTVRPLHKGQTGARQFDLSNAAGQRLGRFMRPNPVATASTLQILEDPGRTLDRRLAVGILIVLGLYETA